MPTARFDFSFWKKQLAVLGYPLLESKIPTQFLRDRRAIPSGVNLKEARLVYQDPLGIDIRGFLKTPIETLFHDLMI